MWLLNGRPVLPDTTHKMLVRETGVHSLLIDPLTQNDAGIYTCIATNKTGQNSFSLELSVVGKFLLHEENQWKFFLFCEFFFAAWTLFSFVLYCLVYF